MSRIEVDWTVDDIPEERETQRPAPADAPPGPPEPPPRAWRWPRFNRRRLFFLTVLLVGLGGGLGAFVLYGWWQLHGQVQAQINYEDGRAFAQDVASVQAVLEDDAQWVAWRAAEVELGLAAPRPLPNLAPVNEPGRLVALTARTENTFDAQVVRTYTDAANRRYEFVSEQRYRQLQPGVWERLAPSETPPTQVWEGTYVRVTYFAADEAWLKPQLLIVDGWLEQACLRWGCPTKPKRLSVRFSSDLHSLPPPTLPVRAADLPADYPLVFDLPVSTASDGVLWPAPALAGRPHNAEAEALYTRWLVVALMSEIADQLSFSTRTPSNYFLDALIARTEIALGLSPAPAYDLRPQTFLPPEQLWSLEPIARIHTPEVVHARLQAWLLLKGLLGTDDVAADRRLLRSLRRSATLSQWLDFANPNGQGQIRLTEWEASARATFQQHPPDWPSLDGLVYQCPSGIYIARPEGPQIITKPNLEIAQPLGEALSPDGRYLAVVDKSNWPEADVVQILDLETQRVTDIGTTPFSSGIYLVGWTFNHQLLYLLEGDKHDVSYLYQYIPGHASSQRLSPDGGYVTPWHNNALWDTAHTKLILHQLASEGVRSLLITLTPTTTLTTLPVSSASTLLAQDGTEIVYAVNYGFDEPTANHPLLVGEQLSDGAHHTLITLAQLAHQRWIHLNAWSTNKAWLAFIAQGESSQPYLYQREIQQLQPFALPRALVASDVDMKFSADDQYLSLHYRRDGQNAVNTLRLVNLSDQSSASYWYQTSPTALWYAPLQVWAPTGHRFAVNSPLGLYVIDAATGDYQWLSDEQCVVGWRRFAAGP